MEYILNNFFVRIFISIFIGLPFSATAFFAGAHGLILGYAGIVNADLSLVMVGILTVTGFLGIIGAWLRLLEPSASMSQRYNKATRLMLYFGLLTSITFSVWAIAIEGFTELSMPLFALPLGGVLFIVATPKSSNNAFKRDAEKASRPLT